MASMVFECIASGANRPSGVEACVLVHEVQASTVVNKPAETIASTVTGSLYLNFKSASFLNFRSTGPEYIEDDRNLMYWFSDLVINNATDASLPTES